MERPCSTCDLFDGGCHCTLPVAEQVITGAIVDPDRVGCDKHEPRQDDQLDEIRDAIEREAIIEGIAYESAMYRLGGRY